MVVAQNAPAEGAMSCPRAPADRDRPGLIDRGADVNAQAKNGMTALMVAVAHNNAPMIGLLMDAGADATLKNAQGLTATDVAEKNGNLEAAQAILVLGSARSAAAPASASSGAETDEPVTMRGIFIVDFHGRRAACSRRHGASSCLGRSRPARLTRLRSPASGRRGYRPTLKDGAFVFHDPKLNADLNLVFEQVKIVRGMEGYGWFANTIFHDKENAQEAVRHRLLVQARRRQAQADGHPRAEGPEAGGRRLDHGHAHAGRLVVAPVQEHPGDMEVTRAWQVMSAIHNYIATNKDANGDLPVKDDKTGETVPLQFVEIHQPVRHLKKDGQYFVCTDFRKPGSTDEYYDIDFWVTRRAASLR